MKAKDIMTREVVTASPELSVQALAKLLTEKKISGVPVMDGGELVGIVTEGDLVDRVKRVHLPTLVTLFDAVIPIAGERQYEEDLRKMAALTASEIMTLEVVMVDEETEMEEIATIIQDEDFPLLPVMRGDDLVGIIGKRDIIRAMVVENGE
ncbi:MAG: CBS domain-containing protein [Magnetococcales bacterium]|nr:CBS domain-containing protein [Magnetococcales bacterium]